MVELILPLVLLIAALQTLVAAFSKSYREAQEASSVTTIWVVTTQADMNIIELRPCPLDYLNKC